MSRLSHPVSEYKITKEELPGWSRPDLVLVIDRRFDRAVQVFSDTHLPDDQGRPDGTSRADICDQVLWCEP